MAANAPACLPDPALRGVLQAADPPSWIPACAKVVFLTGAVVAAACICWLAGRLSRKHKKISTGFAMALGAGHCGSACSSEAVHDLTAKA